MSELRAGVIGTGSMGRHHARVYSELLDVDLVGVSDADPEQAVTVAREYEAEPMGTDELVESVDLVSIAVPTEYHYDVATTCIDAGVNVLVEKPFVAEQEKGVELVRRAREQGVTLQVGHVERFNPAVQALEKVLENEEVLTVTAERLGPPLDREVSDNVVMDLMIHDVDIVLALLDAPVRDVDALSIRDGEYATATLDFEGETVGRLTASRITQEKVRRLLVDTAECRVKVDYIDQSVKICRKSSPEFVERNGNVHYHHEGIVEEVAVDSTEPLKNELQSFVDAVANGHEPAVTGEEALEVLDVVGRIEADAGTSEAGVRCVDGVAR